MKKWQWLLISTQACKRQPVISQAWLSVRRKKRLSSSS
jgi:hypothetical protein